LTIEAREKQVIKRKREIKKMMGEDKKKKEGG